MRKLAFALSIALVAALALVGCKGSSSDNAAGTAGSPEALKAKAASGGTMPGGGAPTTKGGPAKDGGH